jgi:hypothetical protein
MQSFVKLTISAPPLKEVIRLDTVILAVRGGGARPAHATERGAGRYEKKAGGADLFLC